MSGRWNSLATPARENGCPRASGQEVLQTEFSTQSVNIAERASCSLIPCEAPSTAVGESCRASMRHKSLLSTYSSVSPSDSPGAPAPRSSRCPRARARARPRRRSSAPPRRARTRPAAACRPGRPCHRCGGSCPPRPPRPARPFRWARPGLDDLARRGVGQVRAHVALGGRHGRDLKILARLQSSAKMSSPPGSMSTITLGLGTETMASMRLASWICAATPCSGGRP